MKMTNKAYVNELMKFVNIKGNTRAKSKIQCHQKKDKFFT